MITLWMKTTDTQNKAQSDSPKLEFRQPPDERAELLILLCGKRWALICRRDRGYRVLWEYLKNEEHSVMTLH